MKEEFKLGDKVNFVDDNFGYKEVTCPKCKGNYLREIDGVKFKCDHCTCGKVNEKVPNYSVQSGILSVIQRTMNVLTRKECVRYGVTIIASPLRRRVEYVDKVFFTADEAKEETRKLKEANTSINTATNTETDVD